MALGSQDVPFKVEVPSILQTLHTGSTLRTAGTPTSNGTRRWITNVVGLNPRIQIRSCSDGIGHIKAFPEWPIRALGGIFSA